MKKVISLILIAAILLLSSCTSITNVDEGKVKDVSDKITEAIINSVGKEKAERQESHTINAENLDTLDIKSSVGSINISTHDSKDAIINLNITAQTGSKEKSQELVDEFNYSVEESSNAIKVDTSFSELKLDDNNMSTDLSITVPNNIENIVISLNVGDIQIKNINGKYEIQNNVGEIQVEGSKASYKIKTNVGEIKLSEAAAVGSSEFFTNTGDITISFNDITDADSIEASADVGEITLKVPENSGYEAVINEFMEKERTETKNNEHTKIKIRTGVGSIDFN